MNQSPLYKELYTAASGVDFTTRERRTVNAARVKEILSAEPDIVKGDAAIINAAVRGMAEAPDGRKKAEREQIVRALLQAGVSVGPERQGDTNSLFYNAIDSRGWDVARLIMKERPDALNAYTGTNALHYALAQDNLLRAIGSYEISNDAKLLLSELAQTFGPNTPDSHKRSPLEIVLNTLAQSRDYTQYQKKGEAVLSLMMKEGMHLDAKHSKTDERMLHHVLNEQDANATQLLVVCGVNRLTKDKNGAQNGAQTIAGFRNVRAGWASSTQNKKLAVVAAWDAGCKLIHMRAQELRNATVDISPQLMTAGMDGVERPTPLAYALCEEKLLEDVLRAALKNPAMNQQDKSYRLVEGLNRKISRNHNTKLDVIPFIRDASLRPDSEALVNYIRQGKEAEAATGIT